MYQISGLLLKNYTGSFRTYIHTYMSYIYIRTYIHTEDQNRGNPVKTEIPLRARDWLTLPVCKTVLVSEYIQLA